MKEKIDTIKELSGNLSLLYVEDNDGLRANMLKLLGKIFDNVLVAADGEDGFGTFLQVKPQIVITDLNMPNLDGFGMIQKIMALEPRSKVIVLSAFDEKQELYKAIQLGVFRFLHKPAKVPELVDAISDAVLSIQEEENRLLFSNQIKTIFNYQHSMVIMIDKGKFILSNQRFLDFFEVENLKKFEKTYPLKDELLLEHKDFLYSTPQSTWQETLSANPNKLFHAKIKNSKGLLHHFIVKSRNIPEKEGHCVLSFDDVTELNLISLFDGNAIHGHTSKEDKKTILTFMKIIQENSAEVKIHNFYRGLTIVNPAEIAAITEDEVVLKTANPQLKIVGLTNFMTISSEVFPKTVICKSVKSVDMDKQTIVINEMSFTSRSSVDRKFIRLEPDKEHSCMLFHKSIQFSGNVKIVDLSEVSIKIEINSMLPGMKIGELVKISIRLPLSKSPIAIVTEATVFRIDENAESFYMVMLFELRTKEKNALKEYLANRQMALIREFKKMDIA